MSDNNNNIPKVQSDDKIETAEQNKTSKLDPNFHLADALRAGLSVSKDSFRRARHACIWSTIFKRKDFNLVHKATRKHSNIFLIGHGLRYLYENPCGAPTNTLSPIKLLCLWHPGNKLIPKKECYGRKFKFSPNIDIILQAGPVRGRNYVPGLRDLVREKNGMFETDVLYFHNPEWKLHTVPIRPDPYNSKQLGHDPHRFNLVVDKMRMTRRRSWQADSAVFYLQDAELTYP